VIMKACPAGPETIRLPDLFLMGSRGNSYLDIALLTPLIIVSDNNAHFFTSKGLLQRYLGW